MKSSCGFKKSVIAALMIAAGLTVMSSGAMAENIIEKNINISYQKPYDDFIVSGDGFDGEFQDVELVPVTGVNVAEGFSEVNVTIANDTSATATLQSPGMKRSDNSGSYHKFTLLQIDAGNQDSFVDATLTPVKLTDCSTEAGCTVASTIKMTLSTADMDSGSYTGEVRLTVKNFPTSS